MNRRRKNLLVLALCFALPAAGNGRYNVNRRGKNLLVLALCFALPAAGYALVWEFTGPDTLLRVGYLLWLRSSTDDLFNASRVKLVGFVFEIVMPMAVGLVGLAWGRWWKRERDSDR